MKATFRVFPGAIAADELARIESHAEICPWEPGTTWSGRGRTSGVHWLDPEAFAGLYEAVLGRMEWMAAHWNLPAGPRVELMQLARYGPGGWFDWHPDAGPEYNRAISACAPVRHAGAGGGFELAGRGEMALAPGDLVVFPSTACHRVIPVSAGERLSLTQWLPAAA